MSARDLEKGEVKGKRNESFLPFYFRIGAFSISLTRLTWSLEQAATTEPKQSGFIAVDRCFSVIVPHRNNVIADVALLS